jgi:uridine phosphorylase
MSLYTPHHLPITAEHVKGNGDLGRVFFLPGSDGRARRLSEHFRGCEVFTHERQHNVYLGHLERGDQRVDVASVSTGMGCASLDVVVTELIWLGARLLLRVGTAGSIVPDKVRAGSLVIATGGVRDEGASDRYVNREYPAVGHLDWLVALRAAAITTGFADRTFMGVVHAKDSLYAMEYNVGPRSQENHAYMEQLERMRVLASDMETAHLFILAAVHSTDVHAISETASPTGVVRAGSLLAVVGDDAPYASPDKIREAEQAAIDVSLEATFAFLSA